MDDRNGLIFFISHSLIYLAAPVVYVGVVQAALCDSLGAGATIAALPGSAYLLGSFAPILFSQRIPLRMERAVLVWSNISTALLLFLVCVTLVLPIQNSIRIGAVVSQGFIQGLTQSISSVYMIQCLSRGTTLEGRAKAFKWTFGVGPLAAVAGSLGAQFVLNRGIPSLVFPFDFALLYLVSLLCMAGVAFINSRYELPPQNEEPRQPFLSELFSSIRSFVEVRPLVLVWLAYTLWYSTLSAMPNLSLYTKQAIGRDPKELSGLVMALRFGFKCVGGYILGVVILRWGIRAPLIATVALLGSATLWASITPGYLYLLAFGMMGAGELGGTYFPNYVIAFSSTAAGARNQSLLILATPVASLSAALHGLLTDIFGFSGSFCFGMSTALLALWLVLKLPKGSKLKSALAVTK